MPDLSKSEYYWSFSEDFPYADLWFLKSPIPANNSFLGALLPRVQVSGFGSWNHFPKPAFYLPGTAIIDAIVALRGPGQKIVDTQSPFLPAITSDQSSDFALGLTAGSFPGVPNLNLGGKVAVSSVQSIKLSIADPTYTYIYPGLLKELRSAYPDPRTAPGWGNIDPNDVYACVTQLVARRYQLTVTTKAGVSLSGNASYEGVGFTVSYTNNNDNTFSLDVTAKDGAPGIVLGIGTSCWGDLGSNSE